MSLSKQQARVLELIREAAERGERCPTNADLRDWLAYEGLSMPERATPAMLARAGFFRIEVFAHNWRVITLPDGKQTKAAPFGHEPYMIIAKGVEKGVRYY